MLLAGHVLLSTLKRLRLLTNLSFHFLGLLHYHAVIITQLLSFIDRIDLFEFAKGKALFFLSSSEEYHYHIEKHPLKENARSRKAHVIIIDVKLLFRTRIIDDFRRGNDSPIVSRTICTSLV